MLGARRVYLHEQRLPDGQVWEIVVDRPLSVASTEPRAPGVRVPETVEMPDGTHRTVRPLHAMPWRLVTVRWARVERRARATAKQLRAFVVAMADLLLADVLGGGQR